MCHKRAKFFLRGFVFVTLVFVRNEVHPSVRYSLIVIADPDCAGGDSNVLMLCPEPKRSYS